MINKNNRNHNYNNNGYTRDMRNEGPERNWEGYNTDKNVYDNYYENYGHNTRSNKYIESVHEEWPTPWEGRMLKKLKHTLWMEANGWGPERR